MNKMAMSKLVGLLVGQMHWSHAQIILLAIFAKQGVCVCVSIRLLRWLEELDHPLSTLLYEFDKFAI